MKDEAVERVLDGLGKVEAPGGLEGRVLRRLEKRGVGRASVWGWEVGLAMAMVLGGVAGVPRHRTPPQPKTAEMGHPTVAGRIGGHTPGAEARILVGRERPKAEALRYLQAGAIARAAATATAAAGSSASLRNDKQASLGNNRHRIGVAVYVSDARHEAPGLVAGMQSFPAPPEPLTEQERLLVRIARYPQGSGAQFLTAEVREAELAKGDADFDLFFPPSKPLETTEGTQPEEGKENNNEVQPKVR